MRQPSPPRAYKIPTGGAHRWLVQFEYDGQEGVPLVLAGGDLPHLASGGERDVFGTILPGRKVQYWLMVRLALSF